MPKKRAWIERVTLKEYIDNRFDAAQASIEVASTAANARLDSMNEWRQTYGDMQGNFPTRTEVDLQVGEVKGSVLDLERDYREQYRLVAGLHSQVAVLQGRLSALSIALAGLGLLAGVVVPILIIKIG
jgi:hypothetical protein